MSGRVEVIPVRGIPEVRMGDDVGALIVTALQSRGEAIRDGDILVVTSKVVSKADGLVASEAERPDLVLRESTRVVTERRTSTGVTRVVAAAAGPVMAGAGIDASNVGEHDALLLPHDPDERARSVRAQLLAAGAPVRTAVVLSDTAGRPWRVGLTDFALGLAGVRALDDLRGVDDASGRTMAVTVRCLADELAAAGDLVKGKVDGVPVAILRGLDHLVVEDDGTPAQDLVRSGPDDWFALGRAEAVRDALGVIAGSEASVRAGIESVHPEPLVDRVRRAIAVASEDAYARPVRWQTTDGSRVVGSSTDPVRLGRAWGRLEVALAGERLRAETVTESATEVELLVEVRAPEQASRI